MTAGAGAAVAGVLVLAVVVGGACSTIDKVGDDLGVARLGEKVGQVFTASPAPAVSPRGAQGPVAVAQDWRCDRLVEPFELVDNVVALARVSVDQGPKLGGSGRSSPALSASAKATAKHMNWMPYSVEKMYGEALHKDRNDVREASGRRWVSLYQQGRDILARLEAQVPPPRPVEFKLFLTEASTGNAEAYPGGRLYLSQGALERGEAFALFAMAHEIAHVTKRHTTKELQARLVDSSTTLDQLRTAMGARGPNLSLMNRQVQTLQARFLNYSRDQESEADACAVRMMAGIDAATARTAVAAFLKDLGEDGDGTAVARGRLSSHPSYRERKGKIDRVLAYYGRGAEKRAPTPRP